MPRDDLPNLQTHRGGSLQMLQDCFSYQVLLAKVRVVPPPPPIKPPPQIPPPPPEEDTVDAPLVDKDPEDDDLDEDEGGNDDEPGDDDEDMEGEKDEDTDDEEPEYDLEDNSEDPAGMDVSVGVDIVVAEGYPIEEDAIVDDDTSNDTVVPVLPGGVIAQLAAKWAAEMATNLHGFEIGIVEMANAEALVAVFDAAQADMVDVGHLGVIVEHDGPELLEEDLMEEEDMMDDDDMDEDDVLFEVSLEDEASIYGFDVDNF